MIGDNATGWCLGIHGGAGLIRRASLSDAEEATARDVLQDALSAGSRILRDGGDALDAVQAAIVVMEEAPCFNAGRGAVLARDGLVELDAALMTGDRRVGAVGACRTTRSPIRLARAVLDDGLHVLITGDGADAFAREVGLEQVDRSWFEVPSRRDQLERVRGSGAIVLDHDADPTGTVGAVARDVRGHLAAGNSTGGMVNKRPGRLGDSPLAGAGTWAWDATCAVAATGHGEVFVRAAAAHRVSDLVELAGLTLEQAVARALDEVGALGGDGGMVAIGPSGPPVLAFTSAGMYRGHTDPSGSTVGIW